MGAAAFRASDAQELPPVSSVTDNSGVHAVAEELPEIADPIYGTLQKKVIERAITLAFGREPTLEEMDGLFISGSMERCSQLFRELAEARLKTGELKVADRKDKDVIERFAAELSPLIPRPFEEEAA